MKKSILILFSIISLGLISCNNEKKDTIVDDDNISLFNSNDKEMNKAIATARSTFGEFKKTFKENKESNKYSGFLIKQGFPTKNDSKEHMWVGDIAEDGEKLIGILYNTPVMEVDVQAGDTITIDKKLISDWLFIEDSTQLTHGAYTMRVYVNSMTDEEKTAFLEENHMAFAPIKE